jgi:hypothetical protein
MCVVAKMTAALVSMLAAAVMLAGPASAEPGNPCELAINFLCRFVPIAPELDHDIDLTQQSPPVDPSAPPPESLPVVSPCAAGCI